MHRSSFSGAPPVQGWTGDSSKLKEARSAINNAFDMFIQAGQEQHRAQFEERLSEIDRKIAGLSQGG